MKPANPRLPHVWKMSQKFTMYYIKYAPWNTEYVLECIQRIHWGITKVVRNTGALKTANISRAVYLPLNRLPSSKDVVDICTDIAAQTDVHAALAVPTACATLMIVKTYVFCLHLRMPSSPPPSSSIIFGFGRPRLTLRQLVSKLSVSCTGNTSATACQYTFLTNILLNLLLFPLIFCQNSKSMYLPSC